jgi:hypothetical protein
MADFCNQCIEEILGVDTEAEGFDGDLSGLCTESDEARGLYATVLCEGCGPIQVDHTGKCVSTDCTKHTT